MTPKNYQKNDLIIKFSMNYIKKLKFVVTKQRFDILTSIKPVTNY